MNSEKFPKAKLISFEWNGWPCKIGDKRYWRPFYWRMSNASALSIPPVKITWRRPWLEYVIYQEGMDAAFRQFYSQKSEVDLHLDNLLNRVSYVLSHDYNSKNVGTRNLAMEDLRLEYNRILEARPLNGLGRIGLAKDGNKHAPFDIYDERA